MDFIEMDEKGARKDAKGMYLTESTESYFWDLAARSRLQSLEQGLKRKVSDKEFWAYNVSDEGNIYTLLTFLSFFNSTTIERMNKYVSFNDYDVLTKADTSGERSKKYMIYKTNGDFLLVNLGVFNEQKEIAFREDKLAARAEVYYAFAAAYGGEIWVKKRKVNPEGKHYYETDSKVRIMEIMAKNFKEYMTMLRDVKDKFFSFPVILSDRQMHSLEKQIQEEIYFQKLSKELGFEE